MKPIALQMWTVRDLTKEDLAGTLKRIAEIGYAGVETAGLCGHAPAEFRKMCDDVGLAISSVHGPVPEAHNFRELIDTAQTLGCKLAVCGKGVDSFNSADDARAIGELVEAGAQLMRDSGLSLGYHNHWWEFNRYDGRLCMDILLEAAPSIFSQLDTYWASNFGEVDVQAWLASNAARIPLLHIKDGPLVKDQPQTAVGSGKMDVPVVINAADSDVLQWLIVELDHCATDMLDAVAASYEYLTQAGLGKGSR